MSVRLVITVRDEPLARIRSSLAVAGFFCDERPLRGAAGQLDWRLCGLVSEVVAAGQIEGRPGEAVLVPAQGRLQADRLMLLGLGERDAYQPSYFEAATEVAVERSLALGTDEIAMAPLGIVDGGFEPRAQGLLRACLRAVGEPSEPLRIALAVGSSGPGRSRTALQDAAHRLGVEPFVELLRPAPPVRPAAPAGPPVL